MPSIPPRYYRIHRVVVTAAVAPHTMSLSCRKKLAYIYQAKVKKNDSHYHCIWGKFEPPTGNCGIVRTKFNSKFPIFSVARGRVFMYPSNICGEVLVLIEKLHSVTSQFDQLRAVRFQDAINRVTPRRKLKQSRPSAAESSTSGNIEARELNNSEVRKNVEANPVRFQQQQLDDETRALQNLELGSMLDAVQETESKMVEMSALNHLMSTHVLQQAQQIEHLYEQAVEATTNVKLGNKELSQAIQRNSSSRTFLLLFLFVLTFSVLFLDWYS